MTNFCLVAVLMLGSFALGWLGCYLLVFAQMPEQPKRDSKGRYTR